MTNVPELPAKWLDKRYTPGRKDLPELFAHLVIGDKDSCGTALKVLRRIQTDITPDLIKALNAPASPATAWLLRALGERLEANNAETILPQLLPHLDAQDQRLRRYAVHALSRLETLPKNVEAQLWQLLASGDVPLKKAVFETLRKAGTPEFLPELDKISIPEDLAQAAAELKLTLKRKRPQGTSAIRFDADLALELPVHLACYPGLETLLNEACLAKKLPTSSVKPGLVTIAKGARWRDLWQIRLFDRMSFSCQVPLGTPAEVAVKVSELLFKNILVPLSAGIVSFRLDVAVSAASRQFRTEFCTELERISEKCVSQTQAALWQIDIEQLKSSYTITCSPSRHTDPRFSYRQQAALGASHPTLAAALVALAQVEAKDVVWDPFAGAGTELLEAALAAKPRLVATELNAEARSLMQQRFQNLQLTPPEVATHDALQFKPKGVTKIVTNPPLGRRLRDIDPLSLGEKLLRHLAAELDMGAVLSWMNPSHRTLGPLAEQLGLKLERNFHVNMGGITLYMERRVKRPETFKKVGPTTTQAKIIKPTQ